MPQTLNMRVPTADHVIRRRSEIYSVLDEICQDLELTTAQFASAKTSYEAVADWLGKSNHPLLQALSLYAHGSTALGTTVRPLSREDFDVDLICHLINLSSNLPPATVKKLIGDRLREHSMYAGMLEEKKRCWRLNYAREFHLDISPTIPNPNCDNDGVLVPDKSLRKWKPTNPIGYRTLFDARCLLQPRFRMTKVATDERATAGIEPFPSRRTRKGILRRIVQLLKRHRDVHFFDVQEEVAPISIVITTLAAMSYELCVRQFEFETELDVVVATIRMMPHMIERPYIEGRQIYVVRNESTEGENFAERWNTEPARVPAFYSWHAKALADFESIASLEGLDLLTASLSKSLGEGVVRKVMDERTLALSEARTARKLFLAPNVGLTTTPSANATPVPRNTHFGDRAK